MVDVVLQIKVYHGDLAARNILLGEHLVAKVGDFGLSRQLFDYSVYVQKVNCPLPLKWMAVESLRDLEFSIQSDVWSYGVCLYEIFSLGSQPYPNLEWNFMSWKALCAGERMERPDYASSAVYEIMLKCWNINPNERPTFSQLKGLFQGEYNNLVYSEGT